MSAEACTLDWRDDALRRALQAVLPAAEVQVHASVDSTNTRVLDQLRQQPRPLLMVAEQQTQGRGRNGRAWQSRAGDSLTFSLGLPFDPPDWSGLSLAVGVALADALDPAGSGALALKWPNDLWLRDGVPGQGRKLGGILVETVGGVAAPGRACVVGVGLNVAPRPDVQGLSSGYACVHELDASLDAPAVLARVVPALAAALLRFGREGLAPFRPAFARRDLLAGLPVNTTLAGVPHGVADGIDASGALRVRHTAGVALVSSGEVSVRPQVAMAGAH